MGIAARHAGAPYINGEVLNGPDLETDISNVYAQVNGGLSDVNIAAAAGIVGSKIASASITGTQVLDATLTIAKFANSAVSNFKVIYTDTSTASTETGAANWFDVEGITQQTITPGQQNDLILLYFQGVLSRPATGSGSRIWDFQIRFSQNGSATPVVTKMGRLPSSVPAAATYTDTIHALWAYQAITTTALTVKPQYNQVMVSGGGTPATWGLRILAAVVVPARAV